MNELMTNEEYHADSSRISKSGLDLIAKSPAHYYAAYLDPNRKPEPKKKHFIIGSITHAAVLEPHTLERDYFILDDRKIVAQIGGGNPRATTKYRDWKLTELQLNDGKQEVNIQEWDAVRYMRDSVHAHPAASVLLAAGRPEVVAKWHDIDTGAPCKLKADWVSDENWLVDLKTTDDARAHAFGRSAWNYRYHVQGAFYSDGWLAANGLESIRGFVFIAVEKEAPYAVALYHADDRVIKAGREAYKKDLQEYVLCRQMNHWPSYPTEVRPLQLPNYAV